MNDFRIGYGYDVHRLAEGESLILGGVHIEHPKGLVGHSDADVLIHAIIDALFGAVALGDIGTHFPDDDPAFKNANSRKLLVQTVQKVKEMNYNIANIDATVIAQQPRLAPYIKEMRTNIAADTSLALNRVSVKATTTEKLGFEGLENGISAQAAVLINRN